MLQLGYVREEQPIKQKRTPVQCSQLKAHKHITTVNSRTTNTIFKSHENTNQNIWKKCFTFFFHAAENVKSPQKRVGVLYLKTTKILLSACHNICLETILWALETVVVRGTQYTSRTGVGQMDWDHIAFYALSSLSLLSIILNKFQ